MKALVFYGPRQLKYEEVPDPTLRPGHVLLEVVACGICGTDLHVYQGMPATWPVPGVRGHEFVGTVIEAAADVDGVAPGDRVVVQPLVFCGRCAACARGETNLCSNMYLIGGEQPGGFAERTVVPASAVFKLPDHLFFEHAALVETLATPVHAFNRYLCGLPASIAIIGAGTQGLLATQLARLAGTKHILVVDVVEHRIDMARRLGATVAVNSREVDPIAIAQELTGGEGIDWALEAAGKPVSRQQALAMLRAGGTTVFLALGAEPTTVDFMALVPRELHLHGTQCYTNADFARAITLLADGDINAEPLITCAPLFYGPEAFESLLTKPGDKIKVVLQPG